MTSLGPDSMNFSALRILSIPRVQIYWEAILSRSLINYFVTYILKFSIHFLNRIIISSVIFAFPSRDAQGGQRQTLRNPQRMRWHLWQSISGCRRGHSSCYSRDMNSVQEDICSAKAFHSLRISLLFQNYWFLDCRRSVWHSRLRAVKEMVAQEKEAPTQPSTWRKNEGECFKNPPNQPLFTFKVNPNVANLLPAKTAKLAPEHTICALARLGQDLTHG